LEDAPRVRIRSLSDRQQSQLAELAVLNEKLARRSGLAARQRLEFLRSRRRSWELVYKIITKEDAATTLALIEEAHSQVRF
jgi:chlorophyllide a oxygenase